MSYLTHWKLFGRAACDPCAKRVTPSEHLSTGETVDCDRCLPLLRRTRACLDRINLRQRLESQQRDQNERAVVWRTP